MNTDATPKAVLAADTPARTGTSYPSEFAARVAGRRKHALGDLFGLTNFGVNLVALPPGSQSSLRHRHSVQDEFVFVLSGELTLVRDDGEARLGPGMCAGFPAAGSAHHLINRSDGEAVYLEIGDRFPADRAEYPDDDLQAEITGSGWRFSRKNGASL
jgi:uncharacterized cupin superfamily protein